MPAFHDIRFPEKIGYGAVGGPGFKTSVFTRASGAEDRNVEWQYARAEYDVAHMIKTQKELDDIRAFFFARRGMAHGFRFKDWSDYKSCAATVQHLPGDQFLGVTDGASAVMPLVKHYADEINPYIRKVSHPAVETVVVAAGGAQLAPGVDFIVQPEGRIILSEEYYAIPGTEIRAGFHYDVPVRFGTDRMMPTLEDYNVSSWGQIPIVEIRLTRSKNTLIGRGNRAEGSRWRSSFPDDSSVFEFLGLSSEIIAAGGIPFSDSSTFDDGSSFALPNVTNPHLVAQVSAGSTTFEVSDVVYGLDAGGFILIDGDLYEITEVTGLREVTVASPTLKIYEQGTLVDVAVPWRV